MEKLKNVFKNKKIIVALTLVLAVIVVGGVVLVYPKYIEHVEDKKIKEKYDNAKYLKEVSKYDEAITVFSQILEYEDSSELLKDTKYSQAVDLYNQKKYDEAVLIFNEIKEYKDSSLYIEKIPMEQQIYELTKDYVGIYNSNEAIYDHRYIFDGVTIREFSIFNNKILSEKELKISKIENNKIICYEFSEGWNLETTHTFIFDNKNISLNKKIIYNPKTMESVSDDDYVLKKISTKTNINFTIPKQPNIGMTKEEVEYSTWGKPNKINKSTYSWGTTEQWVYSGYRYIFFENGKVTSISE